MGTVVRFLLTITVGLVLALALTACEDENVCPRGSEFRDGRCHLVPVATDANDAFAWPPEDARGDVSLPPLLAPDAGEDAGAQDDAGATADSAAADTAPRDDATPDSRATEDAEGA